MRRRESDDGNLGPSLDVGLAIPEGQSHRIEQVLKVARFPGSGLSEIELELRVESSNDLSRLRFRGPTVAGHDFANGGHRDLDDGNPSPGGASSAHERYFSDLGQGTVPGHPCLLQDNHRGLETIQIPLQLYSKGLQALRSWVVRFSGKNIGFKELTPSREDGQAQVSETGVDPHNHFVFHGFKLLSLSQEIAKEGKAGLPDLGLRDLLNFVESGLKYIRTIGNEEIIYSLAIRGLSKRSGKLYSLKGGSDTGWTRIRALWLRITIP